MTLHRPVGLKELELIAASGWRAYPPRLHWQPIFYPVLTVEYARAIVNQWNSREADAGHCGFVTAFDIDDAFVGRYPVQQLGGEALRACPCLNDHTKWIDALWRRPSAKRGPGGCEDYQTLPSEVFPACLAFRG